MHVHYSKPKTHTTKPHINNNKLNHRTDILEQAKVIAPPWLSHSYPVVKPPLSHVSVSCFSAQKIKTQNQQKLISNNLSHSKATYPPFCTKRAAIGTIKPPHFRSLSTSAFTRPFFRQKKNSKLSLPK